MAKKKENPANAVKRRLWTFGYSVKDYSALPDVGYDLLVEGKIRVKVGTVKPDAMPDACDVYALVGGKGVSFITRPATAGMVVRTSPLEVFGKRA